jgi:hypothetical protein
MNAIRSIRRTSFAAALLLCLAAPAFAKRTPGEVLGLKPGMTDSEVHRRLSKIGAVVRGKDRGKQTWKLRDPRYGYLVLRYDEEWRLHWVTAFAREGGRRVRYRDVGDLALAEHTGQHFYTWKLAPKSGPDSWTLVARGGDPQYLESISIHPTPPARQALVVPAHGSQ